MSEILFFLIAFLTGWSSSLPQSNTGSLQDTSLFWKKPEHSGQVPLGALVGGHFNGKNLYICRAKHNNTLTPGKTYGNEGICYVAWGGAEHIVKEYEVLTIIGMHWEKAKDGIIPAFAVVGGYSEHKERLYICRVHHHDVITVGKLHPSHKVCYIPIEENEHSYRRYEVLVHGNKPI